MRGQVRTRRLRSGGALYFLTPISPLVHLEFSVDILIGEILSDQFVVLVIRERFHMHPRLVSFKPLKEIDHLDVRDGNHQKQRSALIRPC